VIGNLSKPQIVNDDCLTIDSCPLHGNKIFNEKIWKAFWQTHHSLACRSLWRQIILATTCFPWNNLKKIDILLILHWTTAWAFLNRMRNLHISHKNAQTSPYPKYPAVKLQCSPTVVIAILCGITTFSDELSMGNVKMRIENSSLQTGLRSRR